MRARACLTIAALSGIGACQSYSNSSVKLHSPTSSSVADRSSSETTPVALASFILQGLGASDLSTNTDTARSESTIYPSNASVTSLAADTTINSSQSDEWESAQSCNAASVSWRRAHAYSGTDTYYTSTWVTTIIRETTIKPINATPITLCDGYPRIEGSLTSYTNTYVNTTSTMIYSSASAVCHTDCPDCTINSQDCSRIWSSWNAYTSSNSSDISRAYSTPACPSPTPTATSSSYNSRCHHQKVPCTFTAGPVRLAYFPVEVQGDRLCGNYSTVQPPNNLTAPVTAEAYGTTFTSGTAYISFESLRAYDGCGEPTGTAMSNFFLPLPSADVSSMCGSDGAVFASGPTSTLLNFADLDYPIATNVYKCQAQCLWGVDVGDIWKMNCRTIYDDYKPVLAYPTQVQGLQSDWNQCWFDPDTYFRYQRAEQYYLFDPPIALTPAASMAVPTLNAQPAHKTSTPVQQTSTDADTNPPIALVPAVSEEVPTVAQQSSVITSGPKESKGSKAGPMSLLLSSKPTNTEGQSPDASDPSPTKPVDPGNDPIADPDAPAQVSGNARSASRTLDDPIPVPAGLSVLAAALSQAIETVSPNTRPSINAEHDPGGLDQITAPASPGNIVTVLPAAPAPTPVAVSRSGTNYIVDGQTIRPGSAATVGDQVVSVAPGSNGLVWGGSSTVVPDDGSATSITPTPQELATVVQSGSAYIVAGQTLVAGQVATFNGKTLSILPSAERIVVDGETFQPGDGAAAATGVASNGITISRAGSGYVINGQTVPTGSAVLIAGTTATLFANGNGLIIGTTTLSLAPGAATTLPNPEVIPTDFQISRAASNFIINNDQTLTPGQIATISGTPLSALSNATGLVVGTRTISLSPGAGTTLPSPSDPVNLLDITRSGAGIFVEGHTLIAGETTLLHGAQISVFGDGAGILIGSTTISLSDHVTTTIRLDAEGTMTPSVTGSVSTAVRPGPVSSPSGTITTSRSAAMRSCVSYWTAALSAVLSVVLTVW